MIRRATVEDIPAIVDLGARFLAYSPHREVPFDPEGVAAFARQIIAHGAVFLSEDGMCGGMMTPLYFSPSTKVAAELVWFAPVGGRELKAAFEAWAKEQGAYAIQFSALADERAKVVDRIYRRSGFEPVETAYFKRL